ncbi:MAG: phosphotransferase [Candidatus Izemoplasmataceae bacterium]
MHIEDLAHMIISKRTSKPFTLSKISHNNTTYIYEDDSEGLILKIVRNEESKRLKVEYDMIQFVKNTLKLNTPNVLAFEQLDSYTYLLRVYIKGEPLISHYNKNNKNLPKYLFEAGRICATLHKKTFDSKGVLSENMNVKDEPIYTQTEFNYFVETIKKNQVIDKDKINYLESLDIDYYYQNYPNVLCHSDYNPRNIIVDADDDLVLIDFEWASAAPRFDDLACFDIFLDLDNVQDMKNFFYEGYQTVQTIELVYFNNINIYKIYRLVTMIAYQVTLEEIIMKEFYDKCIKLLIKLIDYDINKKEA